MHALNNIIMLCFIIFDIHYKKVNKFLYYCVKSNIYIFNIFNLIKMKLGIAINLMIFLLQSIKL